MELFVQSSRGYSKHNGMSEETVRALLQELGATDIVLISAEVYQQAMQSSK